RQRRPLPGRRQRGGYGRRALKRAGQRRLPRLFNSERSSAPIFRIGLGKKIERAVAKKPQPAVDAGSVTVNTAPPSGELATSMLPLCSFSTDLQMLSPNPVPRPGRLVV